MKQIIRWQGLLGFVLIIGLLLGFFMLLAAPLFKLSIEYGGSKIAGAKVELDDVDLSFNPLGFKLTNLQITNANKPMQNIVQIGNTQANLELAPLFQGKFMLHDLNMQAMRFHTERKTSGAIKQKEKAKDAPKTVQEKLTQVAKKLPSAEEMLAREPLKTIAAGEALKQSYATYSKEIEQSLNALPDSNKLSDYEKRANKLLNTPINNLEEFKQRKQQLDRLKADIKADKQAVANAKNTLDSAQQELREKFKQLKQAPNEDYQHLSDKYKLNAQGVTELAGLLFGPKIGSYAKQTLYWYQRLRPYLASALEASTSDTKEEKAPARLIGRYVHFPTARPWVSFLIRKGELSASVPTGNFAIRLNDITNEQIILGKPSTIQIAAQKLPKITAIAGDIILDYRKKPGTETAKLQIKNWNLDNLNLGMAGIQLNSAKMNTQLNAQVRSQNIQSKLTSKLYQTNFSSTATTLVGKELGIALKGINNFNINATANGQISSPKIGLNSNLEQKVSQAIQARLNAKQKELEAKLKAKLQEKMQAYAGKYTDKLQQLDLQQGNLNASLAKLEKLGSAELEDFKKQQQRKAQEKRKAEEERLKKEAEAKRKAEEDKLKKEAEAKRKAEEDKLKNKAQNKLKSLF